MTINNVPNGIWSLRYDSNNTKYNLTTNKSYNKGYNNFMNIDNTRYIVDNINKIEPIMINHYNEKNNIAFTVSGNTNLL